MKQLKEIVVDSVTLASGLRENGSSHKSYKMYTSIDRALATIVSGDLYLSNGSNWNDKNDRELMKAKNSFAICLSCSTSENIAMWMLYSGEHGKRGAMLDFSNYVLKEILQTESVELGSFNKIGTFEPIHKLTRDDFEIFLTDILYIDECKNGKVKITFRDEHVTKEKKILENKDIFYKNYGWSYEKECKLTVRLSDDLSALSSKENLGIIRIHLSPSAKRKMNEERLYRSPIFTGGVSVGKESLLTGGIEWDII